MQVGLGALVDLVVARAVLAPAILPALALVADLPGRDDVLPFDARGAVEVLARRVAAGGQVDLVALVLAAAIKLRGLRRVQLPGDLLGLLEGARGVGVGEGGKQQQAGGEKRNSHARSVFLRHGPENLYAAIVAVGEGDVVVLGDFLEQGCPVVGRLVLQAEDQGGAAALGGGAVDDLLDALTQEFITAWRRGGGFGHGAVPCFAVCAYSISL